MNKTNFIKHLEDNYKNYSWIKENGSIITINNGVRIKIDQPTTISYSIEVAGKYNFEVYSSNDMYEDDFDDLFETFIKLRNIVGVRHGLKNLYTNIH